MQVAIIQFDVMIGQVKHNEALVAHLVEQAAAQGAEVVVLPELWNMGYDLERLPSLAQTAQGSSVQLLQQLAKRLNLFIFGGTIGEKKGDKFYNTAIIVDQNGDVVHRYRKVHLFPVFLREQDYFEAGEEWGIVDTPWGTVGVITCYDLRFPALAHNLVLRGAKAIFISAQWPSRRIDHWQLLAQARAIENQVYVFACNRTGKDSSGRYPGCSMVIDPLGNILAGGMEAKHQGIIMADIEFENLADVRYAMPVLENRRRILDEIDDGQF